MICSTTLSSNWGFVSQGGGWSFRYGWNSTRRSGFDVRAVSVTKSADSYRNRGKNPGVLSCGAISYLHYLQYLDLSLGVLNGWCLGGLYIGSNSTLWKMLACFVFGCIWSKRNRNTDSPNKTAVLQLPVTSIEIACCSPLVSSLFFKAPKQGSSL